MITRQMTTKASNGQIKCLRVRQKLWTFMAHLHWTKQTWRCYIARQWMNSVNISFTVTYRGVNIKKQFPLALSWCEKVFTCGRWTEQRRGASSTTIETGPGRLTFDCSSKKLLPFPFRQLVVLSQKTKFPLQPSPILRCLNKSTRKTIYNPVFFRLLGHSFSYKYNATFNCNGPGVTFVNKIFRASLTFRISETGAHGNCW